MHHWLKLIILETKFAQYYLWTFNPKGKNNCSNTDLAHKIYGALVSNEDLAAAALKTFQKLQDGRAATLHLQRLQHVFIHLKNGNLQPWHPYCVLIKQFYFHFSQPLRVAWCSAYADFVSRLQKIRSAIILAVGMRSVTNSHGIVRGGLGDHMHPKSWHCQNWVDPPPPNPDTLANLANKSM